MSIKADKLVSVIMGTLSDYEDEISEGVKKEIEKAGKDALKEVKARSPKRSGRYKKGWRMGKRQYKSSSRSSGVVIYNKTDYQLTHLLEYGHQKASGGRVEGKPHIRPAEQAAEKKLIQEITDTIERAGVK